MYKLTWLALGEDPAAPSRKVEQFTALIGDNGSASTARGFEPLRAEPNGFLVHHLSHSVTLSMCKLEQACRPRHVLTIGV